MHKLGLANLSISDAGPLALLDAAGAAGFDAVNLWLLPPPAMNNVNAKRNSAEPVIGNPPLIREVRRCTDASGVRIFQASCGWLSGTFDPSKTRNALETVVEIGATRLALVGWDANRTRLIEHLGGVCREAAAYDITVSIEFMPYSAVRSVEDVAGVLDAVGVSNLDVLVDALHLARSGGQPADLKLLNGRIGSLQLCDAPAASPAFDGLRDESVNRRLLPGEGELPLRNLLDAVPLGILVEIEAPTQEYAGLTMRERARLCAESARRFLEAAVED